MKSTRRKARLQSQPARVPIRGVVESSADSLIRFLLPLSIVVLTFVAFLPSLQNGFVNWDDEAVLLDNPNYRGLGWEQLRWMFTTFHMSVYRPIAWKIGRASCRERGEISVVAG